MKVLFLDIDGVLNSWQSVYWEIRTGVRKKQESLCPICMSNLDEVLDGVEDLKIVISSTWRKSFTMDELKKCLTEQGFKNADRIIGHTPFKAKDLKFSEYGPRWGEIKEWLDEHPEVTEYAILDDHGIAEKPGDYEHIKNFIQTDQRVGLDWHKADELRKVFGGKEFGVCMM